MSLLETLGELTTEAVNPNTADIDLLETTAMVALLHSEYTLAQGSITRVVPQVAQAVDMLVDTVLGGRCMVYVGAGTSGRLGILDASEMPPTYGVDADLVGGIIAGGTPAVFASVENAEDNFDAGATALATYAEASPREIGMVIGLSASGRTPFVIGALKAADEQGMLTVLVSTNNSPTVHALAPSQTLHICPQVGPEPIAGSTRMKSGSVQKQIINMITTAAMVRLGKTYGNVMIDLKPTNEKLRARAIRTVSRLGMVSATRSEELLTQADWNVKTSIVMARKACSRNDALELIQAAKGRVRTILGE